jgi:hypothetical protein
MNAATFFQDQRGWLGRGGVARQAGQLSEYFTGAGEKWRASLFFENDDARAVVAFNFHHLLVSSHQTSDRATRNANHNTAAPLCC